VKPSLPPADLTSYYASRSILQTSRFSSIILAFTILINPSQQSLLIPETLSAAAGPVTTKVRPDLAIHMHVPEPVLAQIKLVIVAWLNFLTLPTFPLSSFTPHD
jgi:hypothetical protein